mmetsp:Transcript_47274/g.95265  ORF Transcript_47274/g.95265 Transcript_47274/m.95265 type:complete len:253 (+) Transcript_47274:575-1333(+)
MTPLRCSSLLTLGTTAATAASAARSSLRAPQQRAVSAQPRALSCRARRPPLPRAWTARTGLCGSLSLSTSRRRCGARSPRSASATTRPSASRSSTWARTRPWRAPRRALPRSSRPALRWFTRPPCAEGPARSTSSRNNAGCSEAKGSSRGLPFQALPSCFQAASRWFARRPFRTRASPRSTTSCLPKRWAASSSPACCRTSSTASRALATSSKTGTKPRHRARPPGLQSSMTPRPAWRPSRWWGSPSSCLPT